MEKERKLSGRYFEKLSYQCIKRLGSINSQPSFLKKRELFLQGMKKCIFVKSAKKKGGAFLQIVQNGKRSE